MHRKIVLIYLLTVASASLAPDFMSDFATRIKQEKRAKPELAPCLDFYHSLIKNSYTKPEVSRAFKTLESAIPEEFPVIVRCIVECIKQECCMELEDSKKREISGNN